MALSRHELKDKVHKRLRVRLILYFVISIAVLGISIFHIIKDNANLLLSLLGLVAGLFIGVIVSRMYKISWDTDAEQVISKFDAIGVIFLVSYITFDIFREKIVDYFVSGPSVIAVSFAVLAGVMYGRVLGIRGKIQKVFKEEGIV